MDVNHHFIKCNPDFQGAKEKDSKGYDLKFIDPGRHDSQRQTQLESLFHRMCLVSSVQYLGHVIWCIMHVATYPERDAGARVSVSTYPRIYGV